MPCASISVDMSESSNNSENSQAGTHPSGADGYQVLARKYRPQNFEDMIGQEAMVKTLTNAFKTGRIAHAFMLTGVRGIGKTTTARLLARALNYETQDIKGPSVDFSVKGVNCDSIMASSHMDVLEMDAASRTGVENMREMLDGVRYAPVSARYKVYIIDEVHMLSTGAFNALLKTLEEPPDHAKFIFATTEIRKVPITVLSRCQRFDLRRVEAGELSTHLKGICEKEGAQISEDGLGLIARAAEGSVRDALSLLDQAIVQRQTDADIVSFEQVRDMLGLADRVRVLDLFALAAKGDAPGALGEMRAQYDHGADPLVIMRDMLDICHEVSRAKALGEGAGFDAAPDQIARLSELAEHLTMGQITRLWQMLLKAHADVKMAPTPLAAAEMALLRMSVAAELPPPEWVAKILETPGATQIAPNPAQSTSAQSAPAQSASAQSTPTSSSQTPSSQASSLQDGPDEIDAPMLQSQSSLAPKPHMQMADKAHFSTLKEIAIYAFDSGQKSLSHDIERYIRLVNFAPGKISFALEPNAPPQLVYNLKEALRNWTGQDWQIIVDSEQSGAQTLRDQARAAKLSRDEQEKNHPDIMAALSVFSGAKVVEVRDRHADNIIKANFKPKNGDA